jgi:two-component system, chemotaxis family, CheB/CheR fusion protein
MAEEDKKIKSSKQKNSSAKKTAKTSLTVEPPEVNRFPIVGIGASAGGLEAIEGFFKEMPDRSMIAFVIIQHLDPKHKSIMDQLLKKYTEMDVKVIEDGMKVRPNTVYLNPPNRYVSIYHGKLELIKPDDSQGVRLPIDYFFRILAEDQGDMSICIVLSGTGTDGTLGLKEIKGKGGMTMAQAESQTKYNGMPGSAIDTGLVDFVLSVERMPEEIIKYVKHPYIEGLDKKGPAEEKFQNYMNRIFIRIRSVTGHDFSHYKQNTTRRRIERRMAVHQIDTISDYFKYMNENRAETEALFKDMLIGVTNFFRDPEAYDALKKRVLPKLLKERDRELPIRVWVAGCSTGEEAYSLAMILDELTEKTKTGPGVQIFATDLDPDAIEQARSGIYTDSIAADVTRERLERYFTRKENVYIIKKRIRERVVFAVHNLAKDPPFSKLDMISCRNLMIYMDSVLQKKVLPIFHYTLNKGGILFLGPSESISGFTNLFTLADSKNKIYRSKGAVDDRPGEHFKNFIFEPAREKVIMVEKKNPKNDARELAERIILESFGPPSVIVDEKFDILYFIGETGRYLTPPVGEPSLNILKMAREEFRYKLSTGLHSAVKNKKEVIIEGVRVEINQIFHDINIFIKPVSNRETYEGMFLVVFHDKTAPVKKKNKSSKEISEDPRIITLQKDLDSTREYLQTTIEELETSNEELKSANEELQSMNEELQSTNEELETSKEELQSTNEELVTVNSELQGKVDELSESQNDINNLLASTEIGTIFLDMELRIKRYTPAMTKIMNLIPTDIGRPVSDLTVKLDYEFIHKDAKECLDTLAKIDKEIKDRAGNWFSMRIIPYRTVDNVINGVVITFIDMTKVRSLTRLAAVVKDSNDAVTVLEPDGSIIAWNRGAENMYGYSEKEALELNISKLASPDLTEGELDFMEKLKNGEEIESFAAMRLTKEGKLLKVWVTITGLAGEENKINAYAVTERDITWFRNKSEEYEKKIKKLEDSMNKQ